MSDIEVKFQSNSEEIGELFEQACERALERMGLSAEGFAKKEISRPKPHADGTSRPNVDTGNLRNSISNKVKMNEKSVYIGTNIEYAPYVELGTSRSKAYPFLKPAATEHSATYKRIIEDEMKKA